MTPLMVRPLDLTTLQLGRGGHIEPNKPPLNKAACLMEAVSYIAGEPWSDQPQCVSKLLSNVGVRLNDVLDDECRQELRQFIPALLDTHDDGLDPARSLLALKWSIHTLLPAWLDFGGLAESAESLRRLNLGDLPLESAILSMVRQVSQVQAQVLQRAEDFRTEFMPYHLVTAAREAVYVSGWKAIGSASQGAAERLTSEYSIDLPMAIWCIATEAAQIGVGRLVDWSWGAEGVLPWDEGRQEMVSSIVAGLQSSAIELFGEMITLGKAIQ